MKLNFADIKSSLPLCLITFISLAVLLHIGLWMLGIDELSRVSLIGQVIFGAGMGIIIYELERVKQKKLKRSQNNLPKS